MNIFPVPASLRSKAQVYDYSDCRWIRVSDCFSANFKNRVIDFKYEVSKYISNSLDVCAGVPAVGEILVSIELDKSEKSQFYTIDCQSDGIWLTASDEVGAFYGLKTLAQVFQTEGAVFKGFRIEDSPEFANRGIMLDVSRTKVPTMDTLYQLVDLMSVLKLNELQLYTGRHSRNQKKLSTDRPFVALIAVVDSSLSPVGRGFAD
ncbi:MAG: family 20 glycosylhydrolase [Kiritimatiellae bacterium]|jgi:hypothetical protein|nr:family 20 glycosylhydrolase [Kiritimatiellia bacterium]